jgi:hypothetical protein
MARSCQPTYYLKKKKKNAFRVLYLFSSHFSLFLPHQPSAASLPLARLLPAPRKSLSPLENPLRRHPRSPLSLSPALSFSDASLLLSLSLSLQCSEHCYLVTVTTKTHVADLTPAQTLSTDPAVGLGQRRFGSGQVRPTSTDFLIFVILENYLSFLVFSF